MNHTREMATQLAAKRLSKDFKKIMAEPIENCWVMPESDNLLRWYFMFELKDPPFAGAQILCRLIFPAEYPMKAPDVNVLTPNGRYQTDRKLCLSNTGYHSESWSPLWSLNNLIVGFISTFYENQQGIGHLASPAAERKKLASQSKAFNSTHYPKVIAKLFSEGVTKKDGAGDASKAKTN